METGGRTLERKLKLRHILVLGLAYMSPFAIFDTFGIISELTKGHVPASYVFVMIAVLFTVYSYMKMAKVYPSSGSAYTYTGQTIHSNLGFLVGWAVLLDYLFLPMINAIFINIYLSAVFPSVPAWVWILGMIALISALNIAGVRVAVSANILMVVFQALVAIIFVVLSVYKMITGDVGNFSFQPFYSESMNFSSVFSGASILVLSFLGFDAVTTLSDESVNPKRDIPRAIFLVALLGGIFFLTVSYVMQSLFPNLSSLKAVSPDIASASPNIAVYIGGTLFQAIFLAGALIACIASGLAAQTSASRLLYAMGKDGMIFKKGFSYIHPKLKTPVFNIVFTAILASSALFLSLYTATSLINFGAYTSFAFVNLSVIFYYFKQRQRFTVKSVIGSVGVPAIGFITNAYLWYKLDASAMIIGLIWTAIGVAYLLYATKLFKKAPPKIQFDESIVGQ
ncbi:Putrescine importer PuuP [Bacillus sp. MUM 116]|uniref:APC family permease n=1 Tax=Bacillus sp. MUM 116 TaxID=1678002 RepID=UPI0008F5BEBE|nr:APC family permease [Bacillus sp. MUM 116]OIK10851.1 Putrescine importer PuuP [Bacillus sp. MUM 116]